MNLDSLSVENLGISVSTSVSKQKIVVGDTFDFSVSVSWKQYEMLPLFPGNSVHVKALETLGLKQVSSRGVENGNPVFKNEFIWTLVAKDTGNVSVPPLSFRIPAENQQALTVKSEETSFYIAKPLNVFPLLAGIFCGILLIVAFIFRKRRRNSEERNKKLKNKELEEILEAMLVLKTRTNVMEPKDFILELERLAKRFFLWKFQSDNVKELEKSGQITEWKSLLKVFTETHYGASLYDALELREFFKQAFHLMHGQEFLNEKE